MEKRIAVLAGDGIGPEVMAEALRVLDAAAQKFGHRFDYREGLIGGAAYLEHKNHFPDQTERICRESDAILFGSVGGPAGERHLEHWKDCEARSLLEIRQRFQFYANLRPLVLHPELTELSPLRPELVREGVDILIVRELSGDLYFGAKKRWVQNGNRIATDMAQYDEEQIARVARAAFAAARARRRKVTSVDKANVLETSKLWREVVREVARDWPDVILEEMLVDNCAMQIVREPSQFDVLLTTNLFGDILSDAAAALAGSLGLLPSASLNPEGFGFYEPAGGSAPELAGRGIANPLAQILSAALMLRHSFGLVTEAQHVEAAVTEALRAGARTADLALPGAPFLTTRGMTDAVLARL